MIKLSKRGFKEVEKYVVSKGKNLNNDRCTVVDIDFGHTVAEITCCMDEIESEIRVCQKNRQDTEDFDEIFSVSELNKLSHEAVYSSVEEVKYKNYVEVIKMETECCDRNCAFCGNRLNR
ncbi:hypothetical protein [Clostridium estertheticum]|uniref:hypothetical protein n=1 Tax=Clostridium estertheticum TaxID=238834 RepID=UPI001C0DE977|nr:hypothetical protein [Clostridium estertheticum]MBU3186594.1 hypothetical protein [Clostridium estertheticum]